METEPHYVPVDGRPPRLTLGLRALDLAEWLEIDDHRGDDLRAKRDPLAERRGDAVATLREGEAASAEVLELVLPELTARGLVDVDGRRVTERTTDQRVDLDALHPIDAAGRLVQDACACSCEQAVRGGWSQ